MKPAARRMREVADMPKPLVIPVFIPHAGCPHRCAFCNQEATAAPQRPIDPADLVRTSVEQYQPGGRKGERPVELAFFGGNFLGIDPCRLIELLDSATKQVLSGRVDGIRFSTRPDTVTPQNLELLSGYPVQTVEIGAQSMDDDVLRTSRRGHSAADTTAAVGLLKRTPFNVVLQMMVGLPGDSDAATIETARLLAALEPDGVRIYPTVVPRESALARWYTRGSYRPLTLEAAVNRAKSAAAVFRCSNIPVIRLGLQATQDLDRGAGLLAGPYHPAFGHLVYAAAFRERAMAELAEAGDTPQSETTIRVHPRDIPRMRGERNENVHFFLRRCKLASLAVKPDPEIAREWLAVNRREPVWIWDHRPTLEHYRPK